LFFEIERGAKDFFILGRFFGERAQEFRIGVNFVLREPLEFGFFLRGEGFFFERPGFLRNSLLLSFFFFWLPRPFFGHKNAFPSTVFDWSEITIFLNRCSSFSEIPMSPSLSNPFLSLSAPIETLTLFPPFLDEHPPSPPVKVLNFHLSLLEFQTFSLSTPHIWGVKKFFPTIDPALSI